MYFQCIIFQLMVCGVHGEHTQHVLKHVEPGNSRGLEHVPILLRREVEVIVRDLLQKPRIVIQTLAQVRNYHE